MEWAIPPLLPSYTTSAHCISRPGLGLTWPGWLVTYGRGLPVRSPIPVLTGPDVGQPRWYAWCRYHYATPPRKREDTKDYQPENINNLHTHTLHTHTEQLHVINKYNIRVTVNSTAANGCHQQYNTTIMSRLALKRSHKWSWWLMSSLCCKRSRNDIVKPNILRDTKIGYTALKDCRDDHLLSCS